MCRAPQAKAGGTQEILGCVGPSLLPLDAECDTRIRLRWIESTFSPRIVYQLLCPTPAASAATIHISLLPH